MIARLNVGGPARHVTWLTAGLDRLGYRSTLVTGRVPPGEDDMGSFASGHGVAPVVVSTMSRQISVKDVLAVWRLYRLFVRLRPDVVHTHTAKAGTVGRLAGLLYRWLTPAALLGRPRACRFVHTYHGHVFHSYFGPWKTRCFLAIEKWLARLATDRLVVLSPQQHREIHGRFGIGRSEQLVTIPLGLDLATFTDAVGGRRRFRREVGADEADILVGIVGRLTEIKNHRLFLQAVALYLQGRGTTAGPRARFLVLGDGHLRDELQEQARGLGLGGHVVFLGFRDDPEDFYPGLDVVALSSLNEGTPLVLIEALANGRAVVATAVGGVTDLLGQAPAGPDLRDRPYTLCERGVLVRPNDPQAFCQALTRVMADAVLRQAMGERGRRFVQQNHSKERLVADVANLYHTLLAPAASGTAREGPMQSTVVNQKPVQKETDLCESSSRGARASSAPT